MLKKKLFVRTPIIAKWFYPNLIWNFSRAHKKIYLTFDDGPTPEITEKVLELLQKFNAKATFFCVGKQVEKHPEIYSKIIANKHSVGNHTHNHIKGWKATFADYITDISLASNYINTKIFRPPYGKISRKQISVVGKKFRIIMWDVLSYDYDNTISPSECIKNVITNAKNGSIIVFHDSIKASNNLLTSLPEVLDYFAKNNYEFCAIEYHNL